MYSKATRIWFPLICFFAISTASCKKFLATYSQNNSFIQSTDDLAELLVGEGYFGNTIQTPSIMYDMDDDTELGLPSKIVAAGMSTGFHYWQANPWVNITSGKVTISDEFYKAIYKKIAAINTILYNVPEQRKKGGPANELNRISGEAHFLRAWYYFTLVNYYGKPYKPATAGSDFGVPLKTEPAIKDEFVFRSTTKQVYDQILADLLQAEKELTGTQINSPLRVSVAAVQCLLGRVCLFMEDYAKALHYADKIITTNQYQITDLNAHTAGTDFLKRNATDVVFTMGRNWIPIIMSFSQNLPVGQFNIVSDDLFASYQAGDLRPQVFFFRTASGTLRAAKKRESAEAPSNDVSDMFLLRIAEQYLNKAEALAALERFEEARNTLQELRKYRFKPEELTAITAEGAELVNLIRDERRRELCFENHRWFDLRRYGVNSKYPFGKSIRHRSVAPSGNSYAVNGYYELGPYEQDAAAYIVPLPQDEIEFNRGALTNEPRPDRPLKQ